MTHVSPYLATILIAWLIAQGAKYVVNALRTRSLRQLNLFYLSGDMPSAHSATTVALATIVGLRMGVDSAIFAIAALLAGIVMYDAVMVRRSVGEQGRAIRALIAEQKSKVKPPRAAKGHEPLEVLVGALLGICIGAFMYFIAF